MNRGDKVRARGRIEVSLGEINRSVTMAEHDDLLIIAEDLGNENFLVHQPGCPGDTFYASVHQIQKDTALYS